MLVASAFADDTACGINERFAFWLWSKAAAKADRGNALDLPDVVAISVVRDGAKLEGFHMKAAGKAPAGAILVLQGNATLANTVAPNLEPFRALGFDVYVFDFRGFGRSGGARRIRAMLADYKQIASEIVNRGYRCVVVYGYSFGGVLALNSLGQEKHFDAFIIDSTRSRITDFGCPVELDPVEHLPLNCSNMLLITGSEDRMVKSAQMEELLITAEKRGGQVVRAKGWGHPFQENNGEPRMRLLTQFFRKVAHK